MSNLCLRDKPGGKGKILNPKIPIYEKLLKIKKTIDSNGWTKITEHDKTVYFKNYSFNQKIEGNAWIDISPQNLPTDIKKFDSLKMAASLTSKHTDSAVAVFASVQNGANQIYMSAQNKYSSVISSDIICNFRIEVYS